MSPTLLPTMDELSDTPTPLSKLTTLLNLISSKTRLSTPSSLRLETSSWLPEDETWVDQVLSFTGRDIWVVSISFTSGMFLTELSLPGRSPLHLIHHNPLLTHRLSNIFVIGEGAKAQVSLPKGKGVKLSIAEERDQRRRARAQEA